jgi:peptidoglycan/LPS O-acetylase OafA/YrhL
MMNIPDRFSGVYALAVSALVFPAIVFFGARLEPGAACRQLFLRIGAISYPLYLIHDPVRDALWRIFLAFGIAPIGNWQTAVIAGFSLAAAMQISFWFEPWARVKLAGVVKASSATVQKY